MGISTQICLFFSKLKIFGAGIPTPKMGHAGSVFLANETATEIIDVSSISGDIF